VAFGTYGLKSTTEGWITSRQIEASRRVIVRAIRKRGKMWIRIFPDRPVTRKGTEVPMGGGKGAVEHYVAPVKPGTVMFEVDGIPEDAAREVLSGVGHKLPVKTKFVKRT
jgi:large subunit ribosomal protein L16